MPALIVTASRDGSLRFDFRECRATDAGEITRLFRAAHTGRVEVLTLIDSQPDRKLLERFGPAIEQHAVRIGPFGMESVMFLDLRQDR